MKDVRITVMRRTCYDDLIAEYENPIEHACSMRVGDVFISKESERPEGFCDEAWKCILPFLTELANTSSTELGVTNFKVLPDGSVPGNGQNYHIYLDDFKVYTSTELANFNASPRSMSVLLFLYSGFGTPAYPGFSSKLQIITCFAAAASRTGIP